MVRIPATAAASFALILARCKLGIAIAAMIRIMATTISNSINEKPLCLRMPPGPWDCRKLKMHKYAPHPTFHSLETLISEPHSLSRYIYLLESCTYGFSDT